jgi:hypothetical protein
MPQNKDNIFDKPQKILITKKTVSFGNYVYQFRNVTGFGLFISKTSLFENIIVGTLVFLFFGGLFLAGGTFSSLLKTVGWIMFGFSSLFIILICLKPRPQGMILYLNSGDSMIFESDDLNGIKRVVSILYYFMESDREGSYIVNIDQSPAKIGVGYAETIRAKQVGGTINNEPDK